MPAALFLLFNHRFTPAQEGGAREQLGVEQIMTLPPDLQKLWSQIPPELPGLAAHLEPVRQWLAAQAQAGDFALVQGDFGATYLMVRFALATGLVPIYATTSREAVEEHLADGAVNLVHRFRHRMFRRYGV